MIPKSQAIVGLEIDDMVVRAVQTDRSAVKVENYVEVAIDPSTFDASKPKESYQAAIDSAIYKLELGEPETYRLGVTFSDINAGVGNGPEMTDWLTQQVEKLDVSFVYVGHPEISFSPDAVVNDVLALFRLSGVAVSRMELSPVAMARVLDDNTTATLLVGSGVGWQVDLRNGRVFSAYASDQVNRTQPLRIMVDGVEQPPLTTLRDVEVPASLLAEHAVPVAVLCPAVGVAKGIADREAENLLYGQKIEAESEIQRRSARKFTTGEVQTVPESVAMASQAVPTKTTMFQPMDTGEHRAISATSATTPVIKTEPAANPATKSTAQSVGITAEKPDRPNTSTGIPLTAAQLAAVTAIALLVVVLFVLVAL